MNDVQTIYVRLVDEVIDVWTPVKAVHLSDDVYRIIDQAYDRDIETWQFQPGDTVICATRESECGQIVVAVRQAPQ